MQNLLNKILARQGFVMLDGALATELESRGADLDHDLWSAKILVESPELIRQVSRDYLQAGADIIASASYQASFEGFLKHGINRERATGLMQLSVDLAVLAREAFWARNENRRGRVRPLVAASIGPYGACLADGSEYSGDYGLTKQQLKAFHRPRMEVLADTDADLMMFETIPSLLEAEALLELLTEFPGHTAILSFSCKDGAHVCHGEIFADGVELAENYDQVAAVGINCTAPGHLKSLLESVGRTTKPLAVYPNSGEEWVASEHRWSGTAGKQLSVTEWYDAGARIIGGCCRTTPNDIRRMRADMMAYVALT
jgi:homocysteine S-methyltransferase